MGYAIVVPGADYRRNNLGQITPSQEIPIQALAITGESSVYVSAQYTAVLIPTFTTDREVVWSIVSGSEYATISNSGEVIGSPNIVNKQVTIRCASAVDSSVYAEKTITITTTQLVYTDWITSDGTDAIYFPGLTEIWQAKVTLRCTHTGANTYVFCCMYASNSTQARLAAYNNGSNKVSAYVGTGGTINWVTKSNIIYRYVWNLGTSGGANSSCYLYNDATSAQLGSKTGVNVVLSGRIGLFRYAVGAAGSGPWVEPTSLTPSGAKFYGLTVVRNSDDAVLIDLRPCLYDGVAGVYDEVTGTFWPGMVNEGGITAGND